jgi:hypothetical protein
MNEVLSQDFEINRSEILDAGDQYYLWNTYFMPWVDSLKTEWDIIGDVIVTSEGMPIDTPLFRFVVEVRVKRRPFPDNVVLGEN